MRAREFAVDAFLFFFLLSVLGWLVTSDYGFIFLKGTRGAELPEWLKAMSPIARGLFINLTFQAFYWLIALGLFIELLSPRMRFEWNGSVFLAILSLILVADGLLAIIFNGILVNFKDGWYDTMFYGVGFGLLFLMKVDPTSLGMRVVLWTRLIEVGGFFLGYLYIPAAFGLWTGGGDHLRHGLLYMLINKFFWGDFLTQAASAFGAIYFLLQARVRPFWIFFFGFGSIFVGVAIGLFLSGI